MLARIGRQKSLDRRVEPRLQLNGMSHRPGTLYACMHVCTSMLCTYVCRADSQPWLQTLALPQKPRQARVRGLVVD